MIVALTHGGEISRSQVIREAIAGHYANSPAKLPLGGLFEDEELQSTDIKAWIAANRTLD